VEGGGTSHNRTVYASPPVGGSGSGLPRSIASLIPTANLRHILSALQTLRVCLSGPPKRRKQPERYATLPLKLVGSIEKTFDRNKKQYILKKCGILIIYT
jgi:hypothetical protein